MARSGAAGLSLEEERGHVFRAWDIGWNGRGRGGGATVYAARKGAPTVIPLTLGYFTAMEALQVAGHLVVDQCGTAVNQAVTLLSFFHIAFQPFFINALAMYLIPEAVAQRIRPGVYVLCGISAALMLLQLHPLASMGSCRIGQPLCGSDLCLRNGTWHIAWDIPYNGLLVAIDEVTGLNWGFPSYVLTAFTLPLIYGAWRFVLFHALAGPILANLITRAVNEAPAIWCLFSIAIIAIAVFPGLRSLLRSKSWVLWPRAWQNAVTS